MFASNLCCDGVAEEERRVRVGKNRHGSKHQFVPVGDLVDESESIGPYFPHLKSPDSVQDRMRVLFLISAKNVLLVYAKAKYERRRIIMELVPVIVHELVAEGALKKTSHGVRAMRQGLRTFVKDGCPVAQELMGMFTTSH
jgi:hypothetical protein